MLQLLQSLANAALLEGVVLLWAGHGEAQVLYIYVVRVTLVRCITSVMNLFGIIFCQYLASSNFKWSNNVTAQQCWSREGMKCAVVLLWAGHGEAQVLP